MRGLILVNAYAPEIETRQVQRIRQELQARGVTVTAERNDSFSKKILGGNTDCDAEYDFCVYLDKDKYVSRIAEKRGLRLFNRAAAIELCDDKMTTHIALADSGIPMPDTLAGLLCYNARAQVKSAALDRVQAALGYPVIVKEAFGSMGSGVYKADNRAELDAIATAVKLRPHLFQRYIASSCGRDLRVIVIGGKVLGGIIRSSDCDFRSNVGLGGKAQRTDVPSEAADMALSAAKILGLDYCGIDLLFGECGFLLCEVNSNAYFDAFEAATGINVAGAYAEHIVSSVNYR